MLQAICIVFLIKIGGSVKAQEDIFTAVADFEDLLEAHKRVKDYLHFYIERHEKRLAVLKSYLDIYKIEHEKAIKDLYSYLSDPIHVFTLIKHLTVDVYNIKHSIRDETDGVRFTENMCIDWNPNELEKERSENDDENNVESITTNYNMGKYPTMVDLRGAAIAIIRLQNIYALQVEDFSEGKLNSSTYSTPMTASDCFELGQALYQKKEFVNGLEWILEAFRKYNQEEIHYSVSAFDIIEHISFGYAKTGDLNLSLEWIQKILNQDPQNSRAKQIEQICYSNLGDERYKTKANCLKDKEAKQRQLKAKVTAFYRLCRSRSDVPTQIANRLTCRYLTENHPFSKLAPFKIEMLSLDPDLVLFHEVLRDTEIETLKKMAKYQLKRSSVNGESVSRKTWTEYRISKSAWFKDTDSETVARISRRIEQMTGLNLARAESLQVANYGIGGHYGLHHDCLNITSPMKGNRIATVLFYMSEVTQGGATVFPNLGISVFPIKGAAIFWINMHTSGEKNIAMAHTACPVLQGSKWVFTKWINEHGQEFIKPCDPEQHKKDQYKQLHIRYLDYQVLE